MIYYIALIESGKVTRCWTFARPCDAIEHFSALNTVYNEIDEVTPIMLKVSPLDSRIDLKRIINSLITD